MTAPRPQSPRPQSPRSWFHAALALALALCAGNAAFPVAAAEIYSNRTGGGLWSDPSTWRGNKVPTGDDEVVISRGDSVAFDRNDEGKVSCLSLFVDPRSAFTFKTRGGKLLCCVGGPIEAHGAIRLDGTKTANDLFELRFVSEKPDQRVMKLAKGGALLMSGRAGLPDGRRNVLLTSLPPNADKASPMGGVDGNEGTTIDVRLAQFVNVEVRPRSIDNTGSKPNERMNILESLFRGESRINVVACDTPVIADNHFERTGPPLTQAAIYVYASSLPEIRGNTIKGTYANGITGFAGTEGSATDNVIENCTGGVYWYGAGAMIRNLVVRNCDIGVTVTSMSGALENITIQNCKTAYYHAGATAQVVDLKIDDLPKDGIPVRYVSGPLVLVNCNVTPDQIKFDPSFVPVVAVAGKPRHQTVEAYQFVVASIKGDVPPGATVNLVTANPNPPLAPGASDLNVRNSPARISGSGLTPLPKTLESLTVKSWGYDPDGKLLPVPAYMLSVRATPSGGGNPKLLKTTLIKPVPEWYREDPGVAKPTVEVSLP